MATDSSASTSMGPGPGTDDGTGTSDDDDDGTDTADNDARPNWHEDIAPLVAEHCSGCHTDGGIAPFSLNGYEETMPWAAVMAQQIEAGLMPPWHAVETDECEPAAPYKHDARLAPEQVQLFSDWAELAAPEGDPALAAAIPEPPNLDLASPSVTTTMAGSVEIDEQGGVLDFFHCLSFDPGNDQDVYVDGLQVIPGNDAIVHHVLMFVDVNADSAGWTDGVSYNCGGGAGGASNAILVGGWVPGSLPIETPEDVSVLLPAGARIIYNMHYHATGAGPETDDATGVALRWQDTATPYVSTFELIGAPGQGNNVTAPFLIPAGASGHREQIEYAVPPIGNVEAVIWSIANHMHKVGVDMKASIVRGNEEICLVQTPNWDFDWQRIYEYDVPIGQAVRLQDGDIVRVRCDYDNTLDNPSVVEALDEVGLDEPQDVELGEGTLDEMCLAGVGVAIRQ